MKSMTPLPLPALKLRESKVFPIFDLCSTLIILILTLIFRLFFFVLFYGQKRA